jgi:hypothetical protein
MASTISLSADDQRLIDGTISLASLASVKAEIDPLLDTLRAVTARLNPGAQLSAADRQALTSLQGQIKDYLINRDPVRKFTEESLQERIKADDANLPLLKRRPVLGLIAVWTLGAVMSASAFVLPFAANVRQLLAVSLFWLGVHAGIAWFYLSSLANFKAESKRAFGLIVAGTVITGLGTAHYPVVQIFELGTTNPWFAYGGLNEIFALASIFLYLGARAFVQLLGIKTRLTSLSWLVGLIAAGCAVVFAVGRLQQPAHEVFYNLTLDSSAVILACMVLGAGLAWRAAGVVTQQYVRGMRWYSAALALVGFGTAVAMAYEFVVTDITGSVPIPIFSIFIVTELLFLQSGYTFKKYTSQ